MERGSLELEQSESCPCEQYSARPVGPWSACIIQGKRIICNISTLSMYCRYIKSYVISYHCNQYLNMSLRHLNSQFFVFYVQKYSTVQYTQSTVQYSTVQYILQ